MEVKIKSQISIKNKSHTHTHTPTHTHHTNTNTLSISLSVDHSLFLKQMSCVFVCLSLSLFLPFSQRKKEKVRSLCSPLCDLVLFCVTSPHCALRYVWCRL